MRERFEHCVDERQEWQANEGKRMKSTVLTCLLFVCVHSFAKHNLTTMPIHRPLIRDLAPAEFDSVDRDVMGCAFASQNEQGRLFDERVYENDIALRLHSLEGLKIKSQSLLVMDHLRRPTGSTSRAVMPFMMAGPSQLSVARTRRRF